MNILVINCGSSSLKYKLYDMRTESVLAGGGIERLGGKDAFLKTKIAGETKKIEFNCPDHKVGLEKVLETLLHSEYGVIKSLDEISAFGHRAVTGGKYESSQLITDEVYAEWLTYMDLAPLHNPPTRSGYEAAKSLLPNVPNVFVFDTAFHATMPERAYLYAIPYKYYSEDKIRRYGFHGTSHRYVSARVCEILGRDITTQKIITCHIGNGGSITAIDCGKSVDTSMGFTPVAGLVMGTRSGDIDPSVVLKLMKKNSWSVEQAENFLNKECGVAGFTEMGSDMRDIENADNEGNERAALALEIYNYRIKKYIGAYAAAMGGVDVIVFTGGVGEHQIGVRRDALAGLEFLGIKVDAARNEAAFGCEGVITTDDSRVKVLVVPTDEELLIARDTYNLVK